MISKIIPLVIKETTKETAVEIVAAIVNKNYLRAIRAELLKNKTLRALIRSMMTEWLIMRNPTG